MPQTEITIDTLTPERLPDALRLSVEARWPHRREDWVLTLGISRGWVAVDEASGVVGTVIMTPFGATGGAINMVIVSESMRGRGVGRRLFATALEAAKGRRLRLTATPDGEPLYRSLGFAPTGHIFQRQGVLTAVPAVPDLAPGADIADATGADAAVIARLDAAAFGEDRGALMCALQEVGRFALIRDGGTVDGFACVRAFGRGHLIGPVVARSTQDAQALIAYLAAGYEGKYMRFDITSGTGLEAWLSEMDLPQTDDGLVMWTEPPTQPADGAPRTFALGSQALG